MRTIWAIAFFVSIIAGGIGCGGVEPAQPPTVVEEQSSQAADPCYRQCHNEFDDCNRSCAWEPHLGYCLCECSNLQTLCIGECNGGRHNPLRYCEPPF